MVNTSSSKPQRSMIGIIGAIAFFAGMLLAIIGGGISEGDNGTIVLILLIMGIIVGLFNITSKEMIPFLVAAIALVVVGIGTQSFNPLNDVIDGLGRVLNGMVQFIAVLMVPAAVINAIRVVWSLAQPGD
ncbi:MAG: hypothetical protein NTZ04_01300 [Chloroflexi bacterium]|nr:hypothetical protein [Chloroflexota bacterium]